MLKDCSCKGANENCYRCFGRGYYDDDEPEKVLIPFRKDEEVIHMSGPKLGDELKSATRGKRVRSKRKNAARSQSFLRKNLRHKIKCPHCGATVSEKNLSHHITKVHPSQIISYRVQPRQKKNVKTSEPESFNKPRVQFFSHDQGKDGSKEWHQL